MPDVLVVHPLGRLAVAVAEAPVVDGTHGKPVWLVVAEPAEVPWVGDATVLDATGGCEAGMDPPALPMIDPPLDLMLCQVPVWSE